MVDQSKKNKWVWLGLAFVGFVNLSFFALDNIPGGSWTVIIWLMAAIAPLAIFLWLRTGFDPFQSALVLGIPLGISFSIIYLVSLLSNMSDPEAVALAVATALWFPLLGGLVSIVGHFGAERDRNVQRRRLTAQECLAGTLYLFLLFFAAIEFNAEIGAFFDKTSMGIFLSIFSIGIGLAKLRGASIGSVCVDIVVAIALFGAALSTIGWIVASLNGDMKMAGPAMAIGLLTTLYGTVCFCLSFLYTLTVDGLYRSVNFPVKNWHLVEGFLFLFFMTLGPPTLFELFNG